MSINENQKEYENNIIIDFICDNCVFVWLHDSRAGDVAKHKLENIIGGHPNLRKRGEICIGPIRRIDKLLIDCSKISLKEAIDKSFQKE